MCKNRIDDETLKSEPASFGEEDVKKLENAHKAFKGGNLRVLVGAGLSQDCAFPSWDGLVKRLLREVIELLGNSKLRLGDHESLRAALGRDGIVDFAKTVLQTGPDGDQQLRAALAAALYPERARLSRGDRADLPGFLRPSSTHRRLVSMALDHAVAHSNSTLLFTTNYDPLLEIAMMRGLQDRDVAWDAYVRPSPTTYQGNAGVDEAFIVNHLHGFIDPWGEASYLILGESDYIELSANPDRPANKILDSFLDSRFDKLILGASLRDPNIRRTLYQKKKLGDGRRIYAVYHGDDTSDAVEFGNYLWKQFGVEPLIVNSYSDIPELLRIVQFGPSPDAWLQHSIDWLEKSASVGGIYEDGSVREACERALGDAVGYLKSLFVTVPHEELAIAVYVPVRCEDRYCLAQVCSSIVPSSKWAAAHKERRLRLGSDIVQGVGGVAFYHGTSLDQSLGDRFIDHLFPSEKSSQWFELGKDRGWRSILAVTVTEGPKWLPTMSVTITSTRRDPFWRHLSGAEVADLKMLLRKVGSWVWHDAVAGKVRPYARVLDDGDAGPDREQSSSRRKKKQSKKPGANRKTVGRSGVLKRANRSSQSSTEEANDQN